MNKCADLKVDNGGTPMTIADAIIRECADEDWLEDVIYYLRVYLDREYGKRCVNKEDE